MFQFVGTIIILFAFAIINIVIITNISVSDILEKRINGSAHSQRILCGAELVCGSSDLSAFYSSRDYRPAWSTDNGTRWESIVLIRAIIEAELEGLKSEDYHLSSIKQLLIEIGDDLATDRSPDLDKLVDLDLLLTDAFLLYGSHLSNGRVNPKKSSQNGSSIPGK